MPIDPELASVLNTRQAAVPPPDLEGMRADFSTNGAVLPRPFSAIVTDHGVSNGSHEIPVRIYRPADVEMPPLLIFLHGGGFMFGDIETHDAACRHLVEEGRCAVAAVGYRLAPEDPFPAGLEDCQTAVEWLLDHAVDLGLDADRIALGGESAGGNLAAVVARRLADRSGPRLMLQVLIHPLTDFRFQTPSISDVQAPGLALEGMNMVRALYLGNADPLDPDASPGLAENLVGLPSAIIVTVEIDPLRDEGEAYALRLAMAGVETTVIRLPGLVHGFMFESAAIGIVAKGFQRIGQLLRRHFGATPRQCAN